MKKLSGKATLSSKATKKVANSKPVKKANAASKKKATKKAVPKKNGTISKTAESSKLASAKSDTATLVFSGLAPGSKFEPGKPFRIERILSPEEVAAEYLDRKKELDKDFKHARAVLNKWWPKLRKTKDFKRGHITGASVRYRTKFGQVVSPLQVVIGINVANKWSEEEIKALPVKLRPKMLKPIIEDVPVKIVEGSFEFLRPDAASFLRGSSDQPLDPLSFSDALVGGMSICPPGRPELYGTLGVVYSVAGGAFRGLTCDHVLNGVANVNQLGTVGNSATLVERPVGVLGNGSQLNVPVNGVTETVDCATVDLGSAAAVPAIQFPNPGFWVRGITHGSGHTSSPTALVPLFFSKSRVSSADDGFEVWKFGASTGIGVKGMIRDLDNLEFTINGTTFKNNYTVGPANNSNGIFVQGGDSGAMLAIKAEVLQAGAYIPAFVVVGILFARVSGSNSIGIACNMCQVLRAIPTGIPANRCISRSDWRLP